MVANELVKQALDLPVEDRLDLARQLVGSVVTPDSQADRVKEGRGGTYRRYRRRETVRHRDGPESL